MWVRKKGIQIGIYSWKKKGAAIDDITIKCFLTSLFKVPQKYCNAIKKYMERKELVSNGQGLTTTLNQYKLDV